jgi:hypothetical protein
VKREPRCIVVGVELDRLQLEEFGRAAALRRLALDEWAKVAMREKPSETSSGSARGLVRADNGCAHSVPERP